MARLWPDGVREDSFIVASGGAARALRSTSVEAFICDFPAWEDAHRGAGGWTGGWIGLAQVSRQVTARGAHARGALHELTALPGLWLDVDLASEKKPHGATPEALDHVLQGLAAAGLAPSMVVATGPSGRHVYWLFREPLELVGEERAAALARQGEVHAYLHRVVQGWLCAVTQQRVTVDRLIDPTRVLRPAGGTNLKPGYGEFRVHIVEESERRYSLDEIEEALTVVDSTTGPDGGWAIGLYSAHALIPRESVRRSLFESREPLPDEVPAFLARIGHVAPHLRLRIMERDGKPWIAKLGVPCPLCSRPSSPQRAGDSYISVRSGRYRCHHASCVAHQGLSLVEWIRRSEVGVDTVDALDIVRMQSMRRRRPIDLVPAGAPKATREEVALEILQHISQSRVGRACVVSIPTGAGKTRALSVISSYLPHLAIFFENYARLEEFVAAREEYIRANNVTTAPVAVVRKGVMRACAYLEEIEILGAERNIRSEVCGHCDLKATCAAHATASRGEVLLAVHASHATLRNEGALKGRHVIFDEAPVEHTLATWTHTDSAHSRKYAGQAKRQADTYAIQQAATLIDIALELAAAQWTIAGRPQHGIHIGHAKLREMVLGCARIDVAEAHRVLGHLELALQRRTVGGAPDPIFHRLTLLELRGARRRRKNPIPHRRSIEELWLAFAPLLASPRDEAEEAALEELALARGELSAAVGPDGVARLELRRRRRLTARPGPGEEAMDDGVLILSATGALHVERIRALDRACDVELVGIDVAGTAPHMRVHVVSSSTKRTQLVGRGDVLRARGGRPHAWARILGAVRGGLALVRERHGETVAELLRERVGVLTYLAVRQQLDDDNGWRAAQEAAGVRVLVQGHYGLDDTGSNEYLRQDVRLLVTLGHPTWHIGAVQADAEFLRIDPTELSRAMSAERLAQGEGRLRSGWDREGESVVTIHIHVGPEPPDHWKEGGFSTAFPEQREPSTSVDEAVSKLDGPVSFQDKTRANGLISAILAGNRIRTEGLYKRDYRDPLSELTLPEQRAEIAPGDPEKADSATATMQPEALRKAFERALGASGWKVHPFRSVPGRGRASTWAPPDWHPEQVAAWCRERCALLRAESPR